MKWWHWGLIGFAGLTAVVAITDPDSFQRSMMKRETAEDDRRREGDRQSALKNPHHKVSVEAAWPSGTGRFNVGRFTLRNTNDFAVKDIAYLCELKAQSGTVVQTVRDTLFEIIPASGSVGTGLINFGEIHPQARTAECVARRAAVS